VQSFGPNQAGRFSIKPVNPRIEARRTGKVVSLDVIVPRNIRCALSESDTPLSSERQTAVEESARRIHATLAPASVPADPTRDLCAGGPSQDGPCCVHAFNCQRPGACLGGYAFTTVELASDRPRLGDGAIVVRMTAVTARQELDRRQVTRDPQFILRKIADRARGERYVLLIEGGGRHPERSKSLNEPDLRKVLHKMGYPAPAIESMVGRVKSVQPTPA